MKVIAIWPIVAIWLALVSTAELVDRVRRRRGRKRLEFGIVKPAPVAPKKPREPQARSLELGQRYTVMSRNRVITGTLKAVLQSHCGAAFYFECQTPFGLQVFSVCECKLQATARPIVRYRIGDIDLHTTAN